MMMMMMMELVYNIKHYCMSMCLKRATLETSSFQICTNAMKQHYKRVANAIVLYDSIINLEENQY